MNLENVKNKKIMPPLPVEDQLDDFDFKPITSGLGFHQPKTTEIKPVFSEKTITQIASTPVTSSPYKKELNVYQNDLSLFYGQTQTQVMPEMEIGIKEEKVIRLASKAQRVFAYITDLLLIASVLGLVLTIMSRTIEMDLLEVWMQFPNEITPLVLTLFCGFYLIYFSVFEKMGQSTLGKFLFQIKVVSLDNKPMPLMLLLIRSFIGLLNFISLGLFSYFDLQSKVTQSKVVRLD